MAQPSPILTADRGRASATAWGILCLLAAVQVFVMTRSLWKERGTQAPSPAPAAKLYPGSPSSYTATGLNSPPTAMIAPPPVGALTAPSASISAPPPIGSFALPGAGVPVSTAASVLPPPTNLQAPPAALTAPPSSYTPPPQPMNAPGTVNPVSKLPGTAPSGETGSMSVKEMVELAKQVRGLEDMQGALEVLKRADLQYPDNPEVLAETAQCYEKMGLTDKAAIAWRRLEGVAPEKAGGFRALAQRRLADAASSLPASGLMPAPMMPVTDANKVLRLGACQAVKDAATTRGEKVILRIPVQRDGVGAIDPNQVDIDVFFFDRVNGERVAQTIADDPVSTWSEFPVDWSGIGEEPLDVVYFMPELAPTEIQHHGRRSYHGYVVKLYYQHKLQDVAAEPHDLLDFGSGASRSVGAQNPLLPPVAN